MISHRCTFIDSSLLSILFALFLLLEWLLMCLCACLDAKVLLVLLSISCWCLSRVTWVISELRTWEEDSYLCPCRPIRHFAGWNQETLQPTPAIRTQSKQYRPIIIYKKRQTYIAIEPQCACITVSSSNPAAEEAGPGPGGSSLLTLLSIQICVLG